MNTDTTTSSFTFVSQCSARKT